MRRRGILMTCAWTDGAQGHCGGLLLAGSPIGMAALTCTTLPCVRAPLQPPCSITDAQPDHRPPLEVLAQSSTEVISGLQASLLLLDVGMYGHRRVNAVNWPQHGLQV